MHRPTTAVILAAGAGRRLGELGRATSKAMLAVHGRPLIQWVSERLKAAGVERLVVVIHATDQQLRKFLEAQGPETRIALQHDRRGIAEAVVQALPYVDDDAYLACACDSVFDPADLQQVIAAGHSSAATAVVAVQEMGVEATATRSAVEVRDGFVDRVLEKPPAGTTTCPLVALPLYWLPAAVMPHLRNAALVGGERHVTTALNEFIAAGGQVRAVRVDHRTEITTAGDIARAEEELRAPGS